jgi:hypothetical protein
MVFFSKHTGTHSHIADAEQGIIREPAASFNVKQTIIELRVGP